MTEFTNSAESYELVALQAILRHFSALPLDFRSVRWLRHLHTKHHGRGKDIWRQPSCGDIRLNSVCRWLRSWTHAVVSHVRNPSNRAEPDIYRYTGFVFVVFQVPTALTVNFGMLLTFHFLTGFFGSPMLATGGASISDMYKPQHRTYPMAIWGISTMCGPTTGPLVGEFAAQAKGWTWTMWEILW